jgi:hypothetical protein
MRAQIGAVTSGAATAGTALGVKLSLIALVVATGVGAGLYILRSPATSSPAPIETRSIGPAPMPVAPGASSTAVPGGPPTAPTDAAPPLASRTPDASSFAPGPAAPATRAGSPSRTAAAGGSRQSPGSPATPPHSAATHAAPAAPRRAPVADLAREVELVDLAMAALNRGEPRVALSAVQRHAAETGGRGQLAEDAAAIEIEALCQLHDPATAIKRAAFDARFPRSAQRSRLEDRCR